MPVIHVTVNSTGEVRVETRGFTGAACQQASRQLEAALGLVQSETLTAEYYQATQPDSRVTAQDDVVD